MPATGGQPVEEGVTGCLLIEMEGLRVKLSRVGDDLFGIQMMFGAQELLTDLQILQMDFLRQAVALHDGPFRLCGLSSKPVVMAREHDPFR